MLHSNSSTRLQSAHVASVENAENPFAGMQVYAAIDDISALPLTQANFARLSRFIYEYCGIVISEKKRTMLDGRLRRRMRALNIPDVNAYCRYLFDADNKHAEAEITHFIDAITTNKTDFYRESSHFDYLRTKILPQLIDGEQNTIRIWCAASSIGAEPYTLAMVMEEFCLPHADVGYNIVASDICMDVLNKAVIGRYPINMLDPIPEDMRRKYVMLPRKAPLHEFRIVPHLRSKVAFRQLNLMDARYPFERAFDVIFCRNTLIYFDRETQACVLRRLCDCLRKGGYLILGHSESISGITLPLKTVANTIFRRL